jgi:hypothetical protein
MLNLRRCTNATGSPAGRKVSEYRAVTNDAKRNTTFVCHRSLQLNASVRIIVLLCTDELNFRGFRAYHREAENVVRSWLGCSPR